MARVSRLEALAREKLRENVSMEDISTVMAKHVTSSAVRAAAKSALKQTAAVTKAAEAAEAAEAAAQDTGKDALRWKSKNLGMGSHKLTREELGQMKREAVVREREKRRKERVEQEAKEKEQLQQAKDEAVRREKERLVQNSKVQAKIDMETRFGQNSKVQAVNGMESLVKNSKVQAKKDMAKIEAGKGEKRVESKVQLLEYREEAKRREMKRERMRRLAEKSNEENEPRATVNVSRVPKTEIEKYREEAIKREKVKSSKLVADAKKIPLGQLKGLPELEEEFKRLAEGNGVISLSQARALVEHSKYEFMSGSLKGGKFLSWVSFKERLLPRRLADESAGKENVSAKQQPFKHERKVGAGYTDAELEKRLGMLFQLVSKSFQELEKHSKSNGRVHPSDLNAVIGDEGSSEFHQLRGCVSVPRYTSSSDRPVSWEEYRTWLLGEMHKQFPDKSSLLAKLRSTPMFLSEQVEAINSPLTPVPSRERVPIFENNICDDDDDEYASQRKLDSARHPPMVSDIPSTNRPSLQNNIQPVQNIQSKDTERGIEVVSRQIETLENKLEKLTKKENSVKLNAKSELSDESESEEDTVLCESDNNQSKESLRKEDDSKLMESTAIEDERALFHGRCWMLCERKNENWLRPEYALEGEEEWIRSREVCAEVEVTQVQDPFAMYLSVHLLRSGLHCMRQVGIEELTLLTAHCAKSNERMRLSLSKSGNHVQVDSSVGERFQCRSLGPEEWTKEELTAAINAEQAMLAWVRQGKIPKQNDLVQWLLLHCVIRISGDELDQDHGHAHIVLPGDADEFREGVEEPLTSVGTKLQRLNKVSVIRTPASPPKPARESEKRPPTGSREKKSSKDLFVARKAVVDILNGLDRGVTDVQEWFAYRKGTFVTKLEDMCKGEIDASKLKQMFKQCKDTSQVLYSLIDTDVLVEEWAKKTKGLRIADVFDLFRREETIDDPGFVEVEGFIVVIQDVLRLKVPTWQLVIWHHRFPEYRSFIRAIYNMLQQNQEG